MQEALPFLQAYEIWIYILLGLVGIFYLRKFLLAWQELQGAVFGLERENAQGRINQAGSALLFILTLMAAEFILTSFIIPANPAVMPIFTPTLNLLATPTITLAANAIGQTDENASALQETPPAAALLTPAQSGQCLEGQIFISSPQNGAEVSGIVEINGSANVPDFGFYKIEMRRIDEQDWLTILANDQLQAGGLLGTWNTALLPPAVYQLRLVIVDNQGAALPPCEIQISVVSNTQTP